MLPFYILVNNNCVLSTTVPLSDVNSEEIAHSSEETSGSKDLSVAYDVLQRSGCKIHEDTLKGKPHPL